MRSAVNTCLSTAFVVVFPGIVRALPRRTGTNVVKKAVAGSPKRDPCDVNDVILFASWRYGLSSRYSVQMIGRSSADIRGIGLFGSLQK
ncbi:hypothetical protein DPMN_050598 [Dreissena polymorpha]|uniref:Secreted protein n=1 Tax=Dreissena polymorpha TaxID=45954 RepID=A0A9D4CGF8_DREPO|nr:hypothetical protein DPMN_050598 [Dreissena polymorpha]